MLSINTLNLILLIVNNEGYLRIVNENYLNNKFANGKRT